MINSFAEPVKVFIALRATDMRKSVDGLSLLVEEQFERDLFSAIFYFLKNRQVKASKLERGLIHKHLLFR